MVFAEPMDGELDWSILRDGGLSVYRNRAFLAEDLLWLRERSYKILLFRCESWRSHRDMHDDLAHQLRFPSYYGANFNALWDCLSDVEVADQGGMVVLLDRFDFYVERSGPPVLGQSDAKTFLSILARTSRYFLLTGRRFLVLIQSDDPGLDFDGLDGVSAIWNWREWLTSSRGL